MAERRARLGPRVAVALVLLAGVAAVLVAMVVGLVPDVMAFVAGPPPIVRAVLAGLAIVGGARLLLAAIRRIDGAFRRDPAGLDDDAVGAGAGAVRGRPAAGVSDADLGAMVRGVRLVFLAAASLTAAAGWILAEPLPIVIALVIAGVDIVETSFLLLVATRRAR